MRKTLILTDLHITQETETIIGLDPMVRLTHVLKHALEHHADAERLVFLGDLTHHGRVEDYARLKAVLETCPVPVSLTIGNHDNRASAARCLGAHHMTDGFAQSAWFDGVTLFLLLDTVDEEGRAPRHGGWLCDARLRWISAQIDTHAAQQIVAMMHHPPCLTGFAGMDAIRLMNGDALLSLLKAAPCPVHMVCGHVHRTVSGIHKGIPFTILKSPCHQMPMQLETRNSGMSVDEPGAYGILLTAPGTIIVHSEDVFATPRQADLDPLSA